MLPLILPPLFVVVALAFLLYLFFRKLPEVERREIERSGEPSASLLSIGDRIKRVFLGLVERFARWFKLLSLKIHNRLSTLAASARSARLRAMERIAERKRLRAEKAKAVSIQPEPSRSFGVSNPKEHAWYRSEEPVSADTPAENTTSPSSDTDQSSRLRRWFEIDRRKKTSFPSSSEPSFSGKSASAPEISSEETLPPLVSEPLQPIPEERVEREVRKRAADIGRKFGDAVRRLRPGRAGAVFPAHEMVPPQKKEQLEDILVERISLNPRDIEAYERLGDYYLEQNNLVDAKECYRQVLKLSPAYRLVKIKIRRLERLLEKEQMP